jgi:hypothetical protein
VAPIIYHDNNITEHVLKGDRTVQLGVQGLNDATLHYRLLLFAKTQNIQENTNKKSAYDINS